MELLIIIIVGVVIYAVAKNSLKKPAPLDDVENELTDFRITVSTSTSYSSEPESKNKKPGKWVQPGEAIKVGSESISGGYFYTGGSLKSLDGYDTEASLIDPTLKLNNSSPDYGGDDMGYWPTYGQISPQSRAAYIEWLASDRKDPEAYIGYVFLYFYGLERRILVDAAAGDVSDSEIDALINELQRLRTIYGDNRSFNGYATGLLSHAWALYKPDQHPDKSILLAKRGFTSVFKLQLAKTVDRGEPVTSELALVWIKSHPEFSLRTPARRCEQEFDELFAMRYKKKFGDGLVIAPNKTKVQLEYYPASSSLRGSHGTKVDLPDASRLKAPVKKLMVLAEVCTVELEAYSRFIGKPENSRESLAAAAYLPTDLAASSSNSQFDQLKSWIASKIDSESGLVTTEELLSQLGEEAPLKINKKEAIMLAGLVEKSGFGLAPDVRYHQAKPELNGNVVLFNKAHGEGFKPSNAFNQVGTILRLGAMVASIDGHIDNSEIDLLEKLISEDKQLKKDEKPSLQAYLHWRLNTKVNMTGLKARLESISDREKTAVSHILVGVALADGNVDPTEIKQLEKLYTSLGLDKSMVSSDIHSLTSRKVAPEPTASTSAKQPESLVSSEFSLNYELINIHGSETDDVKAILGSIFVDETIDDEPEVVEGLPTVGTITGLDASHTRFYETLITKEQWASEEVRSLCKELNLMMNGAIETLNDWAFENLDAPIVEDGSTVFVDLELAEEIAAL
ncbi:tellurite resistance protein TerB [Sinobacterium caligoides]|uniref:Tellurite resistance protein TerB n=1 Tax=Sinobacterium caligoides TaxID=933926 RepID=A0A3N2DJG2_9GAMM|nr:TerB N-terminal domain-containing protein [Sinobacterium caligoides]ROR99940.1 tellurite resistance protein TerB [Sinobacterium caligoides]